MNFKGLENCFRFLAWKTLNLDTMLKKKRKEIVIEILSASGRCSGEVILKV